MDSRAPADIRSETGSRLEVAAAALADRAAEVEIVVHDARAAGAVPAVLESLLAEARADAASARDELAARVAGEAELVAAAGRLRLELEELRARIAARDERDARIAGLVAEVADAAREAREEVERHAAAREQAERELAAAREHAAAAEEALRAELEAAHTARDRAMAAEGAASAAREAELAALRAAHARLRPAAVGGGGHPAGGGPDGREPDGAGPAPVQLADGLARAAQRLRDATPPTGPPGDEHEPQRVAPHTAAAVGRRRSGLLRRLLRGGR